MNDFNTLLVRFISRLTARKIESTPHRRTSGFTLVELLVSSGLMTIVLAAFVGGFLQHRRIHHEKNIEQELQQNLRTAMTFLQRDLRYAGSGMVMGGENIQNWFGADYGIPTDMDGVPWIVDGGADSDELYVIGVSGEPVATLRELASEGSRELTLDLNMDSLLPYEPIAGDVLLISGLEAVHVVQVDTNQKIWVSREPTTGTVGVHLIYPEGTELHQLNVVRYWVDDVNGVPSLLRDDSRFSYESNEDRVIADGIERFKLNRTGNLIGIELFGRTRRFSLGGSADADSVIRHEMRSSNRIRNLSPGLLIQGWPSNLLIGGDGEGENRPQ